MGNPNGKYPVQRGKGNGNRAKGVPWEKALRKALAQKEFDDGKKANAFRRIADTVVDCALDPESPHYEFAIKEIGARLDGSPKRGEGGVDPTEFLHSISDAFAALNDFNARGKAIDGEVIVPSGSVLPSEVCVEAGGHGEGVDIQPVSDSAGESERSD